MVRFASSTRTFPHTACMISDLDSRAPPCSTNRQSRSKARDPIGIGVSFPASSTRDTERLCRSNRKLSNRYIRGREISSIAGSRLDVNRAAMRASDNSRTAARGLRRFAIENVPRRNLQFATAQSLCRRSHKPHRSAIASAATVLMAARFRRGFLPSDPGQSIDFKPFCRNLVRFARNWWRRCPASGYRRRQSGSSRDRSGQATKTYTSVHGGSRCE